MINFKKIKVVIFVGPSGSGKGTLIKWLFKEYPDQFIRSVSCTSRPMDATKEVEGREYFFISLEEFEKRARENYFIEWEEYAKNLYGTPRAQLEQAKSEGKILVMELEPKGARNLKKLLGDEALVIVITLGNNIERYEKRIRERKRSSDTDVAIANRLARIPEELEICSEIFDFKFLNLGTQETLFRNFDDQIMSKLFPGVKPLSLLEAEKAK